VYIIVVNNQTQLSACPVDIDLNCGNSEIEKMVNPPFTCFSRRFAAKHPEFGLPERRGAVAVRVAVARAMVRARKRDADAHMIQKQAQGDLILGCHYGMD
jgi:hypothetical protein